MKTLDASTVNATDLERLEETVKDMQPDSQLAYFLATLAAAVRDGIDVIAGLPSDLVSPAQAAKLIGISRVHLYKVMDAGELPFVTVGRDRRVSLADVRELLERRDKASKEMAERFARTSTARVDALNSIKL